MQAEKIQEIIAAASAYQKEHKMTQVELARKSSIPGSYISLMLRGETMTGQTEIADKHWVKLALTVGLEMEQKCWDLVLTPQFKTMIASLKVAKTRHSAATIVGKTGTGKTFAIEQFNRIMPVQTYVITLNNLVTVSDILDDMLRQLGEPIKGSRAVKFYNLVMRMRKLRADGGSPIMIFDEAENVTPKTMGLLKSFFDKLINYCSIAVVGTPKLLELMLKNKIRDRDAAPQFYRRFYPGHVVLPDVDMKFAEFFDELAIVDEGLKALLCSLCENYGELNIWLEPVLEEAKAKGVPVSEDMFRMYHNMPR